eukprot:TRINITY_DN748_c0_g1_i1.p1 TRINITY_DN748_c0_g1~~TRINITY_DN748_c0_g1_i1.p1  ORF type:complete len:224 (-),score=36.65 TRINITY_DN748_c0_g1_i1:32-703(-)
MIPMIGVGACVSVQFAAFTQAKKWFLGDNTSRPLSMNELFWAGAFAGVANSVLSAPIEHIRIRLQVQSGATLSPFALMSDIKQKYGLGAIWKGWGITATREFAYGAYFVAYEASLRLFTPKGKTVNDVHPIWLMLSGALGGEAMWIVSYPIDVVKSRIQSDHLDPKQATYKGVADCFKYVWRTEGMYGFWKGFVPCAIRAFPVNAATFAAYELVMRMMGGRDF